MKKLFIFISLIVTISVKADDFKTSFYNLLEKGDFELAEIFLREWEENDSVNPNLFLARFNLFLNKAYKTYIVLDREVDEENDGLILEKDLGSVHKGEEWNDSLFHLALAAIDEGIMYYPDRLDFRLSKTSAYEYRNDFKHLSDLAIDLLEYHNANECQWKWTEDSLLTNVEAKEIMLEYLHDYERILSENSNDDRLLDLNLRYYPDDPIALTLKGSIEYDAGRIDEAKKLLEHAYISSPEDPLIVNNLAYISMVVGDKERADALYSEVMDNENADEDSKITARRMKDQLYAELKEIDLYGFEFQFLPYFASRVVPGETGLEILCNKEYVIGIKLAENGYSIPIDITDVKVDRIGEGEDTIVVWTMPEPEKVPLARYIAFVPDKEAGNYHVYTLERSFDWDGNGPLWILGLTRKDEHSNFGDIPYPETPQEFAEQVLKVDNSDKR